MPLQGRMIRGMNQCDSPGLLIEVQSLIEGLGPGTDPGPSRMMWGLRGKKTKQQGCPMCGLRAQSIKHHVEAWQFLPVFHR
ncbi:hypothetical protein DPMN_164145 [Dreissena polymorpha]|uniref:Uncharacterized protein n=1 Tax=Dreissena polymorpha TaxID=45954 RepID=A0A9D4EUN4_DREPO|nr:hypothetical protein DPMN_164145 [Dreissena polymorpha]